MADSSWQGPLTQVILGQRSRFSLVFRLIVHTNLAIGTRRSRSIKTASLLASAASDVVLARVLRRSSRADLGVRLVADCIDGAIWTALAPAEAELAALSIVPLSIEAGYRSGLAGLLVPAASFMTTNSIRRPRESGPAIVISPFRWPAVAALFGMGLAMLETKYQDLAARQQKQEGEARVFRAWLAGQHDVAIGADTVVDELCRLAPLLGDGASVAIGSAMRDWRRELSTRVGGGSVYLGNALMQWQRAKNHSHADLSLDISFEIDPGHGTRIITRSQSAWLSRACDQLQLRGNVRVTVEHFEKRHLTGAGFEIVVHGTLLSVPKDAEFEPRTMDPGPLGFIIGAYLTFDTTTSSNARCMRLAVVPISISHVLIAMWAQRKVTDAGEIRTEVFARLAAGLSIWHSLAASLTARRFSDDAGQPRLPFLTGLMLLGLLTALYWDELDWGTRALMLGASVCTVGIGVALYAEKVALSDLARELVWTCSSTVMARIFRNALELGARENVAIIEAQLKSATETAFDEGRQHVIKLVLNAHETLNQLYRGLDVGESTEQEIRRRLHYVDSTLEGLIK